MWSIASQPSVAEIIRVADGELLDKTPWEGTPPSAGSGALKVQVRLDGFETEPLTLDERWLDLCSKAQISSSVDKLSELACPHRGLHTGASPFS